MDVSSLLTDSKSHPSTTKPPRGTAPTNTMYQQPSYIKKEESRDTKSTMIKSEYQDGHSGSMSGNMAHSRNNSTVKGASALPPKNVTFQYILTEDKQARARLPMRVNIYPHDETNSIITTVKNFYGIYDGSGVAFEDQDGNTLIARYENLEDKHTVYVRVLEGIESKSTTPAVGMSPSRPRLAPPFELAPAGANISRPSSRTARYRSTSPAMKRFQRGQSVSSFSKSRGRSSNKGRTGSTQGSVADTIMHGDASDSDEGASVTSSRRAKVDAVASAEISVENIVEGGRRKRARFDSSVCIEVWCYSSHNLQSYSRNFHCFNLHRSPCQLQSHRCLLNAESAVRLLHLLFNMPTRTPSLTMRFLPLKATINPICTCTTIRAQCH